jgi:hypothetical protein
MGYRYPKPPSFAGKVKPTEREREGMRNAHATDVTIPGNREDLVGGYRDYDRTRDDTKLLGHPESAAIYCGGEDHRSPTLENESYRMDKNYVSPEEIRRRCKTKPWDI